MLRPTIYRPTRLWRTDEPNRRLAPVLPMSRPPAAEDRPTEEPTGSSEPCPALAELTLTV